MTATYTKLSLSTGEWGIRVHGEVKEGDVVVVTTKAGKAKPETVRRVLFRHDGVAVCEIVPHGEGK